MRSFSGFAGSVRNCPYLRCPADYQQPTFDSGGPAGAVRLVWITRTWQLIHELGNLARFNLGPAEQVEWYVDGRSARRAEVDAAEAEEMPALVRRMDRLELRRRLERFEKWLPTV